MKSFFGRASQPDRPAAGARALDPSDLGLSLHSSTKAAGESAFGGPGILAVNGLQKSYRGRTVVQDAGLHVRARRGGRPARPERRRQDDDLLHDHRPGPGRPGRDRASTGTTSPHLPMYRRARLGIGYLPQEASIFRGLNVEDNIRAVLEVVEPSRKARERKLDALLEEFNITRLRKAPSIALSGGERRRCEIARALAGAADLHAARRALRRHRPDRGRRHPEPRPAPDQPRHRRADHRPQRARDAGPDRPRLHHPFRPRADRGPPDEIVANADVRRLYLGEDFRL